MSETKRTAIQLAAVWGSIIVWVLTLWAMSPGQAPPPRPIQALSAAQIDRDMAQDRLQAQYRAAEATLARQFKAEGCSDQYAGLAARSAVDNHLPPRVVGALIFVESSCRPDAVSKAGAIGLLQVSPRTWHSWTPEALRDPRTNIQAGTFILASYVQESGLREGLHRYNGLGDPSQDYSDRVMQVAGYR